jgi:hypothetical protein
VTDIPLTIRPRRTSTPVISLSPINPQLLQSFTVMTTLTGASIGSCLQERVTPIFSLRGRAGLSLQKSSIQGTSVSLGREFSTTQPKAFASRKKCGELWQSAKRFHPRSNYFLHRAFEQQDTVSL